MLTLENIPIPILELMASQKYRPPVYVVVHAVMLQEPLHKPHYITI